MQTIGYNGLECKLVTYNNCHYLTLCNPDDWGKSHKYGFTEPHYGLWGCLVCIYEDYKKDYDITPYVASVGRFLLGNKTIFALENIMGPVGIPVYYLISKEEHDNPELLKNNLGNYKTLCSAYKGQRNIFGIYELEMLNESEKIY